MSNLNVDSITEKTTGNGVHIPGHVVQVVHRVGGDRVTTTTTNTWTAPNLDLSITPKFANSKILLLGQQPMRIYGSSVTPITRGSQRIKRNVAGGSYTVVWNTAGHQEHIQVRGTNATQELSHVVPWSIVDSPSYSVGQTIQYVPEGYMYNDTNVSQLILWEGSRGSNIQIMEIAQ
jgi:hypothetical protein